MNAAAEVLLTRAIDYAGLFPPAQLSMVEAVDNYRRYMMGEDRWALGRFVCPAERLEEMQAQLRPEDGQTEPWRVSVIARGRPGDDQDRITVFNLKVAGQARVDSVEARTASPGAVEARLAAGEGLLNFCEVDAAAVGWEATLDAVRAGGAKAKLRTGGITADAIPSAHRVIEFLRACRQRGLGFKATAGLHHPFHGCYALTYAPGSEQAPMHGFVNLALAAATLEMGGTAAEAERLLCSGTKADFAAVGLEQMQAGRRFFVGFGSCSFEEPMAWLRQLT